MAFNFTKREPHHDPYAPPFKIPPGAIEEMRDVGLVHPANYIETLRALYERGEELSEEDRRAVMLNTDTRTWFDLGDKRNAVLLARRAHIRDYPPALRARAKEARAEKPRKVRTWKS